MTREIYSSSHARSLKLVGVKDAFFIDPHSPSPRRLLWLQSFDFETKINLWIKSQGNEITIDPWAWTITFRIMKLFDTDVTMLKEQKYGAAISPFERDKKMYMHINSHSLVCICKDHTYGPCRQGMPNGRLKGQGVCPPGSLDTRSGG
jgi:hypothetical protein